MINFPGNPRRWSSSLHEAGHCVTAIVLGRPVWSVEVGMDGGGAFYQLEPRGDIPSSQSVADRMRTDGVRPGSDRVINYLIMDMGGIAAALHYAHPDVSYDGARGDFRSVNELVDAVCECDAQRGFLRRYAGRRANEIVSKHWQIVEAVASRLYDRGKLDRDEIVDAVRSAGGYALLGEEPPMHKPVDRFRTNWAVKLAPADSGLRHRAGVLSMSAPRPALSAVRQREILKALAVRQLEAEGFHPTESNINWWMAETLPQGVRNGQEADEAR